MSDSLPVQGKLAIITAAITTGGAVIIAVIGFLVKGPSQETSTRIPTPEVVAALPVPQTLPQPDTKLMSLLRPEANTWFVQLGAFNVQAHANGALQALKDKGISDARIATPDKFPGLPQGTGYYIVLGPVTQSEAGEYLKNVKDKGENGWIRNAYVPN